METRDAARNRAEKYKHDLGKILDILKHHSLFCLLNIIIAEEQIRNEKQRKKETYAVENMQDHADDYWKPHTQSINSRRRKFRDNVRNGIHFCFQLLRDLNFM